MCFLLRKRLEIEPGNVYIMSMHALELVLANPKSVQLYLLDKRIMRGLGVLLNVKRPTSESSKSPLVIDRQMEVGDLQARALLEKDAGNAAYKKRDLETAIMHYSHGLELVNRVLYLDSKSTQCSSAHYLSCKKQPHGKSDNGGYFQC